MSKAIGLIVVVTMLCLAAGFLANREQAASQSEHLPGRMKIVVVHGSEYIEWVNGYGGGYTHLGNCTNHAEREVEK